MSCPECYCLILSDSRSGWTSIRLQSRTLTELIRQQKINFSSCSWDLRCFIRISEMETSVAAQQIIPKVLRDITAEIRDLIIKNLTEMQIPDLNPSHAAKLAYLAQGFLRLTKGCFKVYFPVHFLMLLIKLKTSKAPKMVTLKRFAIGLLRSLAFSVLYGMSMPLSGTYLSFVHKKLCVSMGGYNLVAGLFASFILLESSPRWAEMSLWVFAQWIQGFTYSLRKRQLVPAIPHSEKLLFGLAFGIIASCYFGAQHPDIDLATGKDKAQPRSKVETLLSFILGSPILKL